MTLQINLKTNALAWPLGQELTDQEIIRQLGLTLSDNGQPVSANSVSINKKAVNPNEAGVYTVVISAVGPNNDSAVKEVQAWVKNENQNNLSSASAAPNNAPTKKKHHTAWIILGIIALVFLIFFGISACQAHNDEVQNQQAQTNALNNANNKIDTLTKQNRQLKNQTDDLKQAVDNYKQDQNKQALQSELNNLKQQNQVLKNSASNQALQNKIDQLDSAIEQIKNHPSQADSAINEMKNSQNQFLQSIQNTFQKMLNDLQNLTGR